MNKILGGLLLVSIISSPVSKIDSIAYELLKAGQIARKASEYEHNEKKDVYEKDIETVLTDIDNNFVCINALLSEKKYTLQNIKTIIDYKISSGQDMSENQMAHFKNLSDFVRDENKVLTSSLKIIKSNAAVKTIVDQLLNKETDYTLVYKELDSIRNNQYKAILSLNNIILECSTLSEIL